MGFFGFARSMARNVGKGLHIARSVGKTIQGMNRAVTKMTGGSIDPLAKLQSVGEGYLEKQGINKEMVKKVRDGYGATSQMYREVQGGDYGKAVMTGHSYAKQNFPRQYNPY